MARIYDNIEIKFEDGLNDIISNVGVRHMDFGVGYSNLRGWTKLVHQVEYLEGDFVVEDSESIHRTSQVLIGMLQ
jgi:hypothetical protein